MKLPLPPWRWLAGGEGSSGVLWSWLSFRLGMGSWGSPRCHRGLRWAAADQGAHRQAVRGLRHQEGGRTGSLAVPQTCGHIRTSAPWHLPLPPPGMHLLPVKLQGSLSPSPGASGFAFPVRPAQFRPARHFRTLPPPLISLAGVTTGTLHLYLAYSSSSLPSHPRGQQSRPASMHR